MYDGDFKASAVRRVDRGQRDHSVPQPDRGVLQQGQSVGRSRWRLPQSPLFADAARFARHSPGDRWFVDETYVKVAGVWRYVYRAVDQYGQVIDVLVSARRDGEAARRFFRRALTMLKVTPTEVVTDAAPVYPRVLDELIPSAWHHVERYENNRTEADHSRLKPSAATDARVTHRRHRSGHYRRARVHAECPPRPLRTRHRHPTIASSRRRIRRTRADRLTEGPARDHPAHRSGNATAPGGVRRVPFVIRSTVCTSVGRQACG